MRKHSILILYAEVMGYNMAALKFLVSNYPVQAFLIGWDSKKLTPYHVEEVEGIEYTRRSKFSDGNEMLEFASRINPEVVFISGWMDKDYLSVTKVLKKRGIPIVSFCDNQWEGTLKQRIARIFASNYLKRKFDFLWVAGKKQLDFAKKLGFPTARVLFGFCPADVEYFNKLKSERDVRIRNIGYPKAITYLGRFAEIKGLDLLLKAFIENNDKDWSLALIGNGDAKSQLESISAGHQNITLYDFKQPDQLREYIINTGIFVLPSKREPWGVVIQEMAAAGIPMITSDACGANGEFLLDGENGLVFVSGSISDLEHKMKDLMTSDEQRLITMGERSFQLSEQYSPATWSATVMKLIANKN